MDCLFHTPLHHNIQRINSYRHAQAKPHSFDEPYAPDAGFCVRNHPFPLGVYVFFFLFCLLIISTCVYLREGDHHEKELYQQAVHKQKVATIETPSMQHDVLFDGVGGMEKKRAKKGKTSKCAEGRLPE